MFPRKKRLSRAMFQAVMKSGRRASSANITVVISDLAGGYAVVIPKKVARLSVTRNKIKRRVLSALKELSLPQSLIIFPKLSVNSVSYKDIKKELSNLIP